MANPDLSSRPRFCRLRRSATVAGLVLAAFSAGLVFAPPLAAGRFNPYQKLGVFTKVLSYVENHYVEDISETDLMYGAARGLTDVLDPHSRFMDPEEYGRLIEEGVGYIKIRVFSSTTDGTLGDLLDQLSAKSKGLKGLVVDLRRNPGGLLDQGIKVADRFIADGLIVKTVGKGGQVMVEAKAHSRGTWSGFPMIVLVDGATASAAEIVAGALQDHGRAVVLGTQTFGKGSVQTVIDLDGCGGKPCGLKLTVARYYTPNGRSIQGQGITPNIVVDATAPPADPSEAELPRERDLHKRLRNEQGEKAAEAKRLDDYQLQMALDYLKSWSVFSQQIGRK